MSCKVRLDGDKAGVWCDFNGGIEKGDALGLVKAVLGYDTGAALAWAHRWLRIADDGSRFRRRRRKTKTKTKKPVVSPPPPAPQAPADPRWQYEPRDSTPIAGTLAEVYLAARGLRFADPFGEVLRFVLRHGRRNPDTDQFEEHPALVAVLRDIHTAEPCGLYNVYLRADGRDRIRDAKGKTTWGRVLGAAVMLDPHDFDAGGLILAEGVETGISLHMAGLRPCWVTAGTSNLTAFPVLSGIEAITLAHDGDEGGEKAVSSCVARWRAAGREALVIRTPAGDFADLRRAS
jgi:hypothetical protein